MGPENGWPFPSRGVSDDLGLPPPDLRKYGLIGKNHQTATVVCHQARWVVEANRPQVVPS